MASTLSKLQVECLKSFAQVADNYRARGMQVGYVNGWFKGMSGSTLNALVRKGYLEVPEADRGTRREKTYRITEAGTAALAEAEVVQL